ncbi:tetratricopeptide repeat protein [Massilia sp. MS-15]|uniref:tetratricopeptide repeat protein n=1 Tax=Massilia sp. MS-15 TaxID=2878200 RepID=UPI001CD561E5|nr:tetratricopeptide repeat protein [Massilia sp. MS-15]MCA1245869.1 sel1 repeat family protein [Massilia sp. MS-15]
MSYRFWVWRQPDDERFPTNLPDTFALLGRLYQRAAPDNTTFPTLAERLMSHFPCSSGSVWVEGALDGRPPGAVYKLDLVWDSADRARPFILSEARALGLSVLDEIKAESHFSNNRLLSLEQTTDAIRNAEQAYREGRYEDAFAVYERLARDGVSSAQHHLGILYEFGHGTAIDVDTALSWYAKAAQRGHNQARHHLGRLYLSGTKVPQNYPAAIEHLTNAAKRRHLESQRLLASMYANGRGTEMDLAQAAYWYGQAAADEDESAQLSLGLAYKNGEGVEKNLETAKWWIRRSASHAYRGAYFAMGTLYLRGEGVPVNLVLAHALHRFASIGNVLMRSEAERLTPDASLDPSTLQKAQQVLHGLNAAANPLDYIEQAFGAWTSR